MDFVASLFEPEIFLIVAAAMLSLAGVVIFLILRDKIRQDQSIEEQQDRLKELEITVEEETQRRTQGMSAKMQSLENEIKEKAALTSQIDELKAKLREAQSKAGAPAGAPNTDLEKQLQSYKEQVKNAEGSSARISALEAELKTSQGTAEKLKQALKEKTEAAESSSGADGDLKKGLQTAKEEARQAKQDLANCKEMYEDLRIEFDDFKGGAEEKQGKEGPAPDEADQKGSPAEDTAASGEKPRVVSPETSSKILEALKGLKQSEQKKPPETEKK